MQPDQRPALWNAYAERYEVAFEPLTNRFAAAALDLMNLPPGTRLVDIGAGTGGAALLAAARGLDVLAVDVSLAMSIRTAQRGRSSAVRAAVTDAMALALAPGCMAAALSIFGLILCPDPAAALGEARRVLEPGAPIAIVTWTEPHRYELVTRLLAAADAVLGRREPLLGPPPAQLRYAAESDFRELFARGGFSKVVIERVEARLEAPNARWLADRLAFAPGLDAMIEGLGGARETVIDQFVATLERDQGAGPIGLAAVAFVGTARS